jgi:hypothetical protein
MRYRLPGSIGSSRESFSGKSGACNDRHAAIPLWEMRTDPQRGKRIESRRWGMKGKSWRRDSRWPPGDGAVSARKARAHRQCGQRTQRPGSWRKSGLTRLWLRFRVDHSQNVSGSRKRRASQRRAKTIRTAAATFQYMFVVSMAKVVQGSTSTTTTPEGSLKGGREDIAGKWPLPSHLHSPFGNGLLRVWWGYIQLLY